VCVETDSQKNASCFTLGTEPIARALGGRCPSWVYPNAGQAGYYRFLLDRRQWVALAGAATSLPPAERIGLVSNAWAAVRQGALAPAALLDVLPKLDSETNRLVVDQIAGALVGIDRSLVDDSVRPAYRKYVANRLVAKRRSLGWTDADPHPAGDDDRALERRTVLWTLGELAEDNATLREAEGYAAQWLRDPTSVSSDIAEIAVPLASKRAGALRLDELRRAAKSAKLPQDRTLALSSMGMFDDPIVLRKALDVILTGEIKTSEVRYVWSQASYRRESRDTAYAWEKEHWAELRSTLSGFYGLSMLVGIAGSMCAPADRDDAKAFFVRAIEGTEGARRPLDESLERAGLCIQLRRASADGVAAYFGRGWL
jgi:alanyl aminopeptidase